MSASYRAVIVPLVGTALAAAPAATAQTANSNAVAAAEDAFGTAVGHEQIGVYDDGNVRGFSPGNAGNFRMEGLYFDIEGGLGNRVLDGETIHVGPSAQGFVFPAPTGIVDLALKKAGAKRTISPLISTDSFGSIGLEVDAALPLIGKELGLQTGLGIARNHNANGGVSTTFNIGAVPHWQPSKNAELTGFYNFQRTGDETAQPIYIPNGNFAPPRLPQGTYPGPDFARATQYSETLGVLGTARRGGWSVRAGLFHSRNHQERGYSNLILINPDFTTERQVSAYPANGASSWSGEARLSRQLADGPRQHLITLALRGRAINARYGGGDSADLGPAALGVAIHVPAPTFVFGALTDDQVRQATAGLSYSLAWQEIATLTAGLQRTHYLKRVNVPGIGPTRGSSTATLPYFSATVPLSPHLSLYGSYVKGLEDAGSAPGYAANANQVLPAIRTSQYDFGLRWAPVKNTTLILGGFHISKPYIDLDRASVFGVLGTETHEGLELSLTSDLTSGLRVVAGGVWQRPRVAALATIAQPVGRRPVGQNDLRTRFNINWTLPFAKAVTLDAYVNHESGAAGTVDNAVIVPGSTRIGGGARYRFKLGGHDVTARISLYNIFNAYMAVPFGNGVYGTNTQRNLQAWITTDF